MRMASRVDHLVLVSNDVPTAVRFYADLLQGEVVRLAEFEAGDSDYPSVVFGDWQINVHPVVTPTQPRARDPRPGSGDFCLWFDGAIEPVIEHLCRCGVDIELGPVPQDCAGGPAMSVYFRDPDGCLVEFACRAGAPR
jgi:catechol 2,3-dioxygenase-like lactoylglutathione lyase family enzyme